MTEADYKKAKQEHAELTEKIEKIDTLRNNITASLRHAEQRLATLMQEFPAVLASAYLGGDGDIEAHRDRIADERQFVEEAPMLLKGLEPYYVRAVNEKDRLTRCVIQPWESVDALKGEFSRVGNDRKYFDMLVRDLRAAAAQVGQSDDAEAFLANLE